MSESVDSEVDGNTTVKYVRRDSSGVLLFGYSHLPKSQIIVLINLCFHVSTNMSKINTQIGWV